MQGEIQIGELKVAAGNYHLALAGVLHTDISAPGGAVIFIRGACPEIGHGI